MHITRKNTIHYNFKIYIILKNSNNYTMILPNVNFGQNFNKNYAK